MKRGKQQILFGYLPGKTFDHESGQVICKVTRFLADEDNRLNKRYVLDRVSWLLNQWASQARRGFPDPIAQQDLYVLATPTDVEAEIFPLLFECTKPDCRRVVEFRSIEQIKKINPELRCKSCNWNLIQLHHVLIHDCGSIRPFIVPRCSNHGYDHIWLDTRGSQKYSMFRWRCRLCNFQQPIVYGICNECNLSNRTMRPIVHRATSSYYPQYRTLINLPGRDMAKILNDPDRHLLAIAAYLRIFDHGPDNKLIDLVVDSQGLTTEQDSIATLERFIQNAPEAMKAILQAKLDDIRQGLQGVGGNRRSQIINRTREMITLSNEALVEAGQELLEFIRPDEALQITTIKQLEERAGFQMPGRVPVYRTAYRDAIEDSGLYDVRLIGDFPVTTVVIGYTRNQREANSTMIRSFPRLRQNDPRVPLFVDTVDTEALIFRLNPFRVLKWLALNDLVVDSPPDQRNDANVRAWILNHMGSVNQYYEIPESDPITRVVFGLVHSFSHLVLRQAVIQSGFDRTSLSEYLFPRALSFVIYSNNRSKFTIGGLYTLFEQTLHEHLRAVKERSEACVYDPVCIEESGSCHACIYVSEMSCENFNRNLSRKYLFGRIEPDGREFIGYWDERCRV